MPPVTKKAAATAAAPRRITLADLNDEERTALLSQAREEAKRNPTDVPGYDELSDAEKARRALMDARDHFRGCPVQEGAELGRVEAYDVRVPGNPATGALPTNIGVVRCIECGGTSALTTNLEEALAGALDTVGDHAGDENP